MSKATGCLTPSEIQPIQLLIFSANKTPVVRMRQLTKGSGVIQIWALLRSTSLISERFNTNCLKLLQVALKLGSFPNLL